MKHLTNWIKVKAKLKYNWKNLISIENTKIWRFMASLGFKIKTQMQLLKKWRNLEVKLDAKDISTSHRLHPNNKPTGNRPSKRQNLD